MQGPQVRTSGGSKGWVEGGTLEGYFSRDSRRVQMMGLPEGTLAGTLEGCVLGIISSNRSNANSNKTFVDKNEFCRFGL